MAVIEPPHDQAELGRRALANGHRRWGYDGNI
jgi:hypothetical protein